MSMLNAIELYKTATIAHELAVEAHTPETLRDAVNALYTYMLRLTRSSEAIQEMAMALAPNDTQFPTLEKVMVAYSRTLARMMYQNQTEKRS